MPGQLIYHYTGLEGLTGILSGKLLWATDIRYLNDTTEVTFGLERVRQLVAEDESKRFPVPEGLKTFKMVWRNFVYKRQSFVACFCSNPDLLSQWRWYGQLGYSIGFDKEALRKLEGGPVPFVLRDMIYDKEEQSKMVSSKVDELLSNAPVSANPLRSEPEDRAIFEWSTAYASDLFELVPRFKHEAFSEEHEVRAEHFPSLGKVRLRNTTLGPTPYVCLDSGTLLTGQLYVRYGLDPHHTKT